VSAAVWLAAAALGAGGAIARFLVDGWVATRTGRTFPFGTLAINLSGSLVLGTLLGATVAGDTYVLAGTATIGSYTTFSTWMYESQRMAEDGRPRDATLNLALSLALGVAAAAAGRWIGGGL
jgi:CrcB protein